MAPTSPVVLILGHSFVRRLCHDLETGFDQREDVNFNLEGTATVFMHGVGGRTVPKLRKFDLHVVKRLSPDIIILEIGTNDLTRNGPEIVGSEIDDFVRLFWIISPSAWSAFVMSYLVIFHVSILRLYFSHVLLP